MNENNDNVNPRKLIMTIRIEFDNNKEINETNVSPTLLIHVMELLQGWKNCNSIEGIYDHSGAIQIEDFKDIDRWLDQPKVTVKKNNIYAELYIQLHTQYTTYQLYQYQKQLCDSKWLKLETKKTILEHTRKLGYIVGPHVKLASSENYTNQIESTIKINEGLIEIKKQTTFERKERSKVLAIYAVDSKASEIDFAMVNATFKNF